MKIILCAFVLTLALFGTAWALTCTPEDVSTYNSTVLSCSVTNATQKFSTQRYNVTFPGYGVQDSGFVTALSSCNCTDPFVSTEIERDVPSGRSMWSEWRAFDNGRDGSNCSSHHREVKLLRGCPEYAQLYPCTPYTPNPSGKTPDAEASIEQGTTCGSDMYWDEEACSCQPISPIVIDVAGNGFNLTDAAGGVPFNFDANDAPEHLSWTVAGSDDSWLVLDRDNNGTIDDGRELFGNFTPQPAPSAGEERNGFRALAVYDANSDGQINAQDGVFANLRLWQDVNHNGVSESGELSSLPAHDLLSVSLDYHESKRTDEHGNAFRYRAKITSAQRTKIGRWAWDVFLQR